MTWQFWEGLGLGLMVGASVISIAVAIMLDWRR